MQNAVLCKIIKQNHMFSWYILALKFLKYIRNLDTIIPEKIVPQMLPEIRSCPTEDPKLQNSQFFFPFHRLTDRRFSRKSAVLSPPGSCQWWNTEMWGHSHFPLFMNGTCLAQAMQLQTNSLWNNQTSKWQHLSKHVQMKIPEVRFD